MRLLFMLSLVWCIVISMIWQAIPHELSYWWIGFLAGVIATLPAIILYDRKGEP